MPEVDSFFLANVPRSSPHLGFKESLGTRLARAYRTHFQPLSALLMTCFRTILIISMLCNARYICPQWRDREGQSVPTQGRKVSNYCMEENALVLSLSSPYSFRHLSRGWPFEWLVSTHPSLVQRFGTGCNTSWGTWAMMLGQVLIR